ncbi:hypothetical protein GH714_001613 [Hevea brasiliensis]|uniref:Alkaline/neutral invertase n=1 Tax=Hevea brasiliensis TaxID=3981 RepID=A0A6A6KM55_HEVBR|nr:hypothetical protein GH714_001613 [Hevea brasiliensis]
MERNLSDIVCYRSRRPSIDEGQASHEEDSSHGPARTHSLDCTKLAELGQPVGTIAALDHSSNDALNYDQALGRIRCNCETYRLFYPWTRSHASKLQGSTQSCRSGDTLVADFGEAAIGLVAPIDSGFWWIILLRAYTKATGDFSLSQTRECQQGMKLILSLCLAEGFDTFPTLLCTDGCCMIDRRMQLNNIYRYKPEEYSHTAVNKFNVIPESIPDWVFDFMPMRGGYFIGNVSPARMDFRWFALGNCIAILSSLATKSQSIAMMDLVEEKWQYLVGEMPLKVAYPAMESHEWRIVTGCDPKNTRWSYHNGGSWPGITKAAECKEELAERRLSKDCWPEYYDGKDGSYIGKQSRKQQTWSVAGYLVAKMLLEDPSLLGILALEEDKRIKPTSLTRANTLPAGFTV